VVFKIPLGQIDSTVHAREIMMYIDNDM